MEEIKRYEPGISGTEYKDGRYVLYTDYAASEEARKKAEEELQHLRNYYRPLVKEGEEANESLKQQNAALTERVRDAEESRKSCAEMHDALISEYNKLLAERDTLRRELGEARDKIKAIWTLIHWPTDDKEAPLRHIDYQEVVRRISNIVNEGKAAKQAEKQEEGKARGWDGPFPDVPKRNPDDNKEEAVYEPK
ncbi:MAG: hypothetical protein WC554_04275 [Clostridia bacterium]